MFCLQLGEAILISIYLGSGSARKITDCYGGVGGIKKIKEIYVGTGGVAKKVWPDNGKFGSVITLSQSGYLPFIELDSNRVVGMKTVSNSKTTLTVDLSIMSTRPNGLSVLGTARKTFNVPTHVGGSHYPYTDVRVIRFNQNGFFMVFPCRNARLPQYNFLIKVTTTSNTIIIHDLITKTENIHSYDSPVNHSGYDFLPGSGEYGASVFSVHYYEEETDDISQVNYNGIKIDTNGTITTLTKKDYPITSMHHRSDDRMIGGGSRFAKYSFTGNREIRWNHFRFKTSGGLYLQTSHRDSTTAKNYHQACTTLPNGAPYALISVPDGVYAYKDNNLFSYKILTNSQISDSVSSNRRYINSIVLNASMDLLVVQKTKTRVTSSNDSASSNTFELYRFNKTNMTVGALLDTFVYADSVSTMRACGNGILFLTNPQYSSKRSTHYISI